MDDQVNINPSDYSPQGVSIDASVLGTGNVSPQDADLRALKARFGLQGVLPQKSKDDWYSDILAGREDAARKEAASAIDTKAMWSRADQMANQQTYIPPTTNTDPKSVIEQGFAGRWLRPYTDLNNTVTAQSYMADAMRQLPDYVQKGVDISQYAVATNQYIDSTLKNLEGQTQGWGSTLQNLMLGVIPGAYSTAMRLPAAHFQGLGGFTGFDPDKPFFGLGLGQEMEQQSSNFWQQPFAVRKQMIDTVVQNLGPNLAKQWLSAMKGQTTEDEVVNNTFDAMDATTVAAPLAELAGDVARGFKGMVKHAPDAGVGRPIEVQQAAAQGNPGEAAVQSLKNEVLNPNQTPVQKANQSLLNVFNLDMDATAKAPGSYGQDIVNRIEAANTNFVATLQDKINTVIRVNRTPLEIATEDVIRAEKDRIKGQFQGASNAIISIDGPEYHQLTNTYHYSLKMGDYDGNMFGSRKQAQLFAEYNGLLTESNPFGHEPIGGMNQAPIQYDNFSQFRDAARKAGVKDKDLKIAGVNNSIAFENAKKSQISNGGFQVKQEGNGFYIDINKPATETSEHNISALSVDTANKQPILLSDILPTWSYIRTPVDTLSEKEVANRRVVSHAPNEFKTMAQNELNTLAKVPRRERENFRRLLEYGQDLYDENGEKGYFYQSPQDIEDWHQLFFNGTLPSQRFIEGYMALKRLSNFDLAARNILVYNHMSISGAENHRIYGLKGTDRVFSDKFVAIPQSEFPTGDHGLVRMGDQMGQEHVTSAARYGLTKAGQADKEAFERGNLAALRIYDPGKRPLSNFGSKVGDSRVRYVLVKKSRVETSPLDVGNMVPRRGGFHFDYNHHGAFKQPDVRWDNATQKWILEGDKTIAFANNQGVGKDLEGKFDNVRQYMQAGMIDEARKFMRETLPVPENEHLGWYFKTKDEAGNVKPPFLSTHAPIYYVPRGKTSADIHLKELQRLYPDLVDGTTSGSDAAAFQVQYTGERDANEMFQIEATGSARNPKFAYKPANLVDPINVSGRALNRVIGSLFTDDMKRAAMTHWLKEAEPYMEASHNEIWSAPWHYYNDPDPYLKNMDPITKGRLEGNRKKQKLFAGAKSDTETWLNSVQDRMAQWLYNKAGPDYANDLRLIPEDWMSSARDPFATARAFVVHPMLGMFNVPTAFVQAATAGNILSIAGPKHALPGMMAAILDKFTKFNNNPKFIAFLDKILSSMNTEIGGEAFWRPGEFTEAQRMKNQTGFHIVGTEHGYIDDPTRMNVVGGKALNWGMVPFEEGAGFVRSSAFYTAYHEFRNGGGGSAPGRGSFSMGEQRWSPNATGTIGREDLADILNRAGTLDHNMSRAANSALQRGAASIPALFASYRLRLTELLWGRSLNPAEKTRLLLFSAALYGLPAGPLGLVGLPAGDWLRKWAIDNGYVVGNNWITSALMEGIPATMIAMATGALKKNQTLTGQAWNEGTDLVQWFKNVYNKGVKGAMEPTPNTAIQLGNFYNIGERYGNEGLFGDINKDQGLAGFLGGAPLGFAQSMAERLGPLYQDVVNYRTHPFTFSDINSALKVLNSYSNFSRTISAFTTHDWVSKNGTKLTPTDVSQLNAIFMGTTGLSDSRTANAYIQNHMMDEAEQNRKVGIREATIEWHNAMTAAKGDPNDPEVQKFKDRAMSMFKASGNPDEKWADFVFQATGSFGQNIVDTNAIRFNRQNVPDDQKVQREDTLQHILNTERKRGERP